MIGVLDPDRAADADLGDAKALLWVLAECDLAARTGRLSDRLHGPQIGRL